MSKKLGIMQVVISVALFSSLHATPVRADGDKGIGPIKDIELSEIDLSLAAKGRQIFTAKCSACHKIEERYVGPALKDVTKRRKPEWIMNMALNPAQMIQEDETAKELFSEFLVPMTFQNVSEADVRSILEYFRASDAGKMPAAAAATPAATPKAKVKGSGKAKK